MEDNKFNKFYSKKSTSDLIELIRAHRINGYGLDKEWFEALILHLSERDISTEERQTVNNILSDDFQKGVESLNKQRTEFEKEQKKQNHSTLIINPTYIIAAGKNLKIMVYFVLLILLFALTAGLVVCSSWKMDTIKNACLLLGAAILICNVMILFQLHSAGDNLENSVIDKES